MTVAPGWGSQAEAGREVAGVPDGARSEQDFRAFVEWRWTALVRFGYLLTGDWGAAEDLTQVALERTWRRWRHVQAGRPEYYVKAAMANQMRSRWRLRTPEPAYVADVGQREPVEGHGERHALRDALWTELLRLPPRMRAVVVLRVWEDLSEQETARLLGMSTGSVKSQMSRGMARLREQPGVLEAAGREVPARAEEAGR
jgi:RNA polymerase sigma-70 factor (sigma-E family)